MRETLIISMPDIVGVYAQEGFQGRHTIFEVVSYLADKTPSRFLGGFPQQLLELSSTGHMSLWAAGCLLNMNLGIPYREFLKEG